MVSRVVWVEEGGPFIFGGRYRGTPEKKLYMCVYRVGSWSQAPLPAEHA